MRMLPWLTIALTTALACDSTESNGPDDHTPASYQILVAGALRTAPYGFTAGQTVRVQLKFFNAAGEDLDDVESTHFAGLTFAPGTLATVVVVAGHHYQFDLTAGAVATGTLTVSFGHDAAADEKVFSAVAVAIVSP
jgi:hypothetical protein